MIELPVHDNRPYSPRDEGDVVVSPGDLVQYKITIGHAVERVLPVAEAVGRVSTYTVPASFGAHVGAGEVVTQEAAATMEHEGVEEIVVRMADSASSAGCFRLLKRSSALPGRFTPVPWPDHIAEEFGADPEELDAFVYRESGQLFFNPDPETGKPFCVGDNDTYFRHEGELSERSACVATYDRARNEGLTICPYRKSRHPQNKMSPCKPYGNVLVAVSPKSGEPLHAVIETTSITTYEELSSAVNSLVKLRTGQMQKVAVGGKIGRFPTIGVDNLARKRVTLSDPFPRGHALSVAAYDAEFRPSKRLKQMPLAPAKESSDVLWQVADAKARLMNPADYEVYLRHRDHVRPTAIAALVSRIESRVEGISERVRRLNAEVNSGVSHKG